MKWHGVSIYNGYNFLFTCPKIFDGTEWKYADPRIYLNNQWETIGAACTNMLWLKDGNGDFIYQNGHPFLVREGWGIQYLLDKNDNELIDRNNLVLVN